MAVEWGVIALNETSGAAAMSVGKGPSVRRWLMGPSGKVRHISCWRSVEEFKWPTHELDDVWSPVS